MSFDGVFTNKIITELNQQICSGRISKIHQPYENEVVLIIRQHGKNHKLLLSAHPSYARIQLTQMEYHNPDTPPTFCTSLRKYLDGAILEKISQIENDRVIHFHFSKRNELGDLENIVLVIELMGRHSAIILLNKANNHIIDCLKHVGISNNSYRLLLPGAEYIVPPIQDKQNPFTVTPDKVFSILSTVEEIDAHYLQQQFQGLGIDTAKELAYRLSLNPNEKMKTWKLFWDEIVNSPQPTLVNYCENNKEKESFLPIPFLTLGNITTYYPSYSELLDAFYIGRAEKERVKQQLGSIQKKLENEWKKNQNKIKKLEQNLVDSENAEDLRRKGELLNTFLHQVDKGAPQVILDNYYEEDQKIVIPLNVALTPAQNAQKYFQKYQKLKNGVAVIQEQLAQTKQEMLYLESLLAQLEIATPLDLKVIQEELIEQNYIKPTMKQKRTKNKKSQPDTYYSSDGDLILVGKNNLQNDQLTLKTAHKSDIWLHAKDIPGSHVIIKNSQPSEQTLLEAAELAAYFSKYRLSSKVPIDYTAVKYVHKPNGSKPGYVIYDNQKTLFVTPKEETIKQLQK